MRKLILVLASVVLLGSAGAPSALADTTGAPARHPAQVGVCVIGVPSPCNAPEYWSGYPGYALPPGYSYPYGGYPAGYPAPGAIPPGVDPSTYNPPYVDFNTYNPWQQYGPGYTPGFNCAAAPGGTSCVPAHGYVY